MEEKKSNSTRFVEIYNELDNYLKKKTSVRTSNGHTDTIKTLITNKKIENEDGKDLLLFAKIRNIIIHDTFEEFEYCTGPIIEPNDYIVDRYNNLKNKIVDKPKALENMAIKIENIYTATMKSNVLDVMKEMNKNTYTHVPIVEDGNIIGVFSENSIFSYMSVQECALLEKYTNIGEFKDFILLDNREKFFDFISKNKLVTEVEEMFENNLISQKRFDVVFITKSGKQTDKLLGMITAWDIAGYRNKKY